MNGNLQFAFSNSQFAIFDRGQAMQIEKCKVQIAN